MPLRLSAIPVVGLALLTVTGCETTTRQLASTHRSSTWSAASAQGHPAPAESGNGVAGGELPDHVTVFNDTYPGVTNLDPALLAALRVAARDARRDGVELEVNSGWRSRSYQEELFEQAITAHGSAATASRWAARPGVSVHETGGAVDLGPTRADDWLSRHGATYGLCQIYRNEPWHYELRPDAADHGCPDMYATAAQDPRLQ